MKERTLKELEQSLIYYNSYGREDMLNESSWSSWIDMRSALVEEIRDKKLQELGL